MVSEEGVRALGLEYRGVLVREVRVHRTFTWVAAVTGLGLLGSGVAISYSFSDLGWLLILVGMLRAATAVYDLSRKDKLQETLNRLDDRADGN